MTQAGIKRPLATAQEVADYYGVPVETLYGWRHRGKGPRASKIAGNLRYRWEDVEAYVEAQASDRSAVA